MLQISLGMAACWRRICWLRQYASPYAIEKTMQNVYEITWNRIVIMTQLHMEALCISSDK
jgi:hypothetical protein